MNRNSQLIGDFARLRSEDAMSRLVSAVKQELFAAEDLWRLADAMAMSGAAINFQGGTATADLASTGGPGSLSTLLCPLYLRGYNLVVPKLGVPGRPAGGIDVLAQLPGYRISLTPSEAQDVLEKCGYVHVLAGDIFAPLDAALFRYRQAVDAQNIPALAVASLLAKKITCGVRFAGLDVRVAPHGNLGGTFADARQSAKMFCSAARAAGIGAVALLTDARTPYQPFIGRGEALLGMKLVFERRSDTWLSEHDDRCRLMAAHVASLATGTSLDPPNASSIATIFAANIKAQGSSTDAFEAKVHAVAEAPRRDLTASREGFLSVDIAALRAAFSAGPIETESETRFPDKLGAILRVKPGAYVRRGDLLASLRVEDPHWVGAADRLAGAFQVVDLPDYAPGMEDIVRA
jgi:pyrimidine-nucleoside phosphorylase